MKYIYIYFWC